MSIKLDKDVEKFKYSIIDIIHNYKNINHNIFKYISIYDVFDKKIFSKFIMYCECNNIERLDQLVYCNFYELITDLYLDMNYLYSIQNTLIEFIDTNITLGKSNVHALFDNIHKDFNNGSINILTLYGIKNVYLSKLNGNNINCINDLRNNSDLILFTTNNHLLKLKLTSDLISQSIDNALMNYLDYISNERSYFIFKLRSEGMTLESIGKQYNVHRERIRQIEFEFQKQLEPLMNIFINKYLTNDYLFENDIINIINKHLNIILYWLKNSKNIEYIKCLNLFVVNNSKEKHIDKIKYILSDYLKVEIDLLSTSKLIIKSLHEHNYTYIKEDHINNLLINFGYHIFGTTAFKRKPACLSLCYNIIKDKFPEGIEINDEHSFDLLSQYVNDEFGVVLNPDSKRVYARINDYLVLCDRGKYTTADKVYIENDLLEEIKFYIDHYLDSMVFYKDVFNKFEHKLLTSSNINNYHYLHGVLKLYFKDDYIFKMKDYLIKKKRKGDYIL